MWAQRAGPHLELTTWKLSTRSKENLGKLSLFKVPGLWAVFSARLGRFNLFLPDPSTNTQGVGVFEKGTERLGSDHEYLQTGKEEPAHKQKYLEPVFPVGDNQTKLHVQLDRITIIEMGMDLSSLQFSLLLQTGTTLRLDPTSASYQVAQSLVQLSFECLQGWRTLSHSGPLYKVNSRLHSMDDEGGGEQEWGGKGRKLKISVFICFCPAQLTHPHTHSAAGKQLCTHHPLESPVCPPSPSQRLQAGAQAAEGLLLGNIALIIRSRPSFLAGEGNYLHLSWAGKASFLLLMRISSPLPPRSFVLCQNPCMGKSWLVAGTGAPQHPWKWVRRGRTLLGWWLDFTPQAPSLTTPHSVEVLGLKWGQICHHRSGRATLLMTWGLRNKRKAPWGNLLTVTLDINLLCFRKSTCVFHTWKHYRGATCI